MKRTYLREVHSFVTTVSAALQPRYRSAYRLGFRMSFEQATEIAAQIERAITLGVCCSGRMMCYLADRVDRFY